MIRTKLTNYVHKTIQQLKTDAAKPDEEQHYEWSRELYERKAETNQKFLKRFNATPGATLEEVKEASHSRKKKKLMMTGLAAAIGPAVVIGSIAGLLPMISFPVFAASVIGIGVAGVVGSKLAEGENEFVDRVDSFDQDIQNKKEPGLGSGSITPRHSSSSSSDDDDFGSIGISTSGGVGVNIGGGLMMGMDGSVGLSLT